MSDILSETFYCRLLVRDLARKHEDEFTQFCFEYGAQGVAEELRFTQPELKYEATVIEGTSLDANVFFAEPPSEEFLIRLKDRFPEVNVTLQTEPNKDWLAEWKKGFQPFLFVEPFWIVPSWHEAPPEARYPLYVDPGMAFGTGTHETTRLAARLVVEALTGIDPARSHDIKIQPKANAASVLDVGTGTGILALVAERLGARPVVAIDNDPEARRVARENLSLNGSPAIDVPDLNLDGIADSYDVVIANIVDGVLLDLKSDLLRVLRSNGDLILSGILQERADRFIENFLMDSGLRLHRRLDDGEWVGLWVRA